ncbi:MAG: iron ABC transporter permease, partial [Anaerolineae bacterium]|nr:iron ABC transporter permease [Anaerolineae bacterium]
MTTVVQSSRREPRALALPRLRLTRLAWVGLLMVALSLLWAGLFLMALTHGEYELSRAEVLRVLFVAREDAGNYESIPAPVRVVFDLHPEDVSRQDRVAHVVVHELRLPRALLAALVGMALALAGAMLQDALGNVLAEPGILGVSSGAVLVVASVTVLHLPIPGGWLPVLAWLGGLGSGGCGPAGGQPADQPGQAGAHRRGAHCAAQRAGDGAHQPGRTLRHSIALSLSGGQPGQPFLGGLLPGVALGGGGIPLALLMARPLNLLQLGDDLAEGLGLPVLRARAFIIALSVAMVAAVVSVAGPVSFVAL